MQWRKYLLPTVRHSQQAEEVIVNLWCRQAHAGERLLVRRGVDCLEQDRVEVLVHARLGHLREGCIGTGKDRNTL